MPELAYPSDNVRDTLDGLRVPPHAIETEQAVLGGLMIANSAWEDVCDLITEEDFYRRDHRLIFRAITGLAQHNEPFDAVTLQEKLDNMGELENAGGLAYLGTLARSTPSAANIKHYALKVREKSVLRQLIQVGMDISNSGYQPEGRNVTELLDQAEQQVFRIAEQGDRSQHGFKNPAKLLPGVVDRIDALYQSGSAITGVPSGFTDIDDLTAGFQSGDLVIVAGRPSMGKTTFAMNVAEHVALKEQLPVAIFSMEMPDEQIIMRMLSSLGSINQSKLRTGDLRDEDWPRITSAMHMLQEAPLYIDDSAALNPTELRARARRLKRELGGKLGMVIVDYLQLMRVSGTTENRATEISEISRGLKALAKELSVPIMALSQLNRGVESRQDKRPMMSDLRESGAIEQDADVIMFIYRDEVYNEDSPHKNMAEIIVAKQRNGPIGIRHLTFLGQYTRFDNYTPDPGYHEAYE